MGSPRLAPEPVSDARDMGGNVVGWGWHRRRDVVDDVDSAALPRNEARGVRPCIEIDDVGGLVAHRMP
jgi:hypothetical protein